MCDYLGYNKDNLTPGLRRRSSSSDATTVVTKESDSISQSPDEQSEVKKPNVVVAEESTLRGRILVLENEKAELLIKVKLAEESAAKEKSDMMRAHTADLENLRQGSRRQQESLDASHRQLKEIQEKFAEVTREKEVLKEDVAKREDLLRVKDGQVNELVAAKEDLAGLLRQMESKFSEQSASLEDLRQQNAALEDLKQVFGRQRAEMDTENVRIKQTADQALAELAGEYGNRMVEASNKIQKYHDELSNSTLLISELRTKLELSQRDASELSETANKRADAIQLQQQQLSALQQKKRLLEQTVEENQSQIRSMEENSARIQAELRNKHSSEIDAQRRLVENLQASLQTLQHDVKIKEDQVVELRISGDELLQKLEKSEGKCRKMEQRAEALDASLAKANSEMRDLEEKAKLSKAEAAREKAALTTRANQLRRQLDDTQQLVTQRVEQVLRLESTNNELSNSLHHVQTIVGEKDLMVKSLQRSCADLEEAKKGLGEQVKGLEKSLVEVKRAAQVEHTKQMENHQREMMQATTRIQGLQDELSSFIATAQQLHTSLETSLANTEKAEKISEELKRQVNNHQNHVSTLQDALHTLEVKSDETTSKLISNERSFKEEKAGTLRRHAAEMDTQRREALEIKQTLQRTLEQKEKSLNALTDENNTLRREVTTLEKRARKNEDEMTSVQATLRDVTQRSRVSLETLIDEKFKAEEEIEQLESRMEELQKELKERIEEIANLKAPTFQKMGQAMSHVFVGLWQLWGTPSQPTNRTE
jgi:chromosome segregation ATPase